MSYKNKVVIVTGASSGIGAATAILFAKEGADVVMIGRNLVKLNAIATECAKYRKPHVVNADVSKDEDAERIIQETVDRFGKIDVLVNNAGIGVFGTILGGDYVQAYDAVSKVNIRAVIHLTVLATPHLIASKGNIVNISSISGIKNNSLAKMGPYSVSKAALDHFTRGAALELAPSGIRVNSVNPGITVTNFFDNCQAGFNATDLNDRMPLKRVSTAEEIADMIAYLAGDKAKGITGSLFVVDNGSLLER
ncbi:hypothetical protein O0L34_g15194 [Tuta absoluta]|nr:hypothetical protein O0L34_g15194 [Tuta absoluta]